MSEERIGNPERGEVTVEVEGRRHVLRLGLNELCALEKLWGLHHEKGGAVARFDSGVMSLSELREFFFVGLKASAPSITLDEAGAIVTRLGLIRALGYAKEALRWSMPEPDPTVKPAEGDPGKVVPASIGAPS